MARLQLIFPFVDVKVDAGPPMALARRAKRDASNHSRDGTARPAGVLDGGMAATYNVFAATTLRSLETKATFALLSRPPVDEHRSRAWR